MVTPDNTIVTIGDVNYLWGIFLLVASARKAGMEEPFLVGIKDFTPEAERILTQLGNISFVSLDGAERSLTCYKPHVMLQAKTEFVTWADSDAFFTGNVSTLLKPTNPEEIHARLRSKAEMMTGRPETYSLQGKCMIPERLLEAWRNDLAEIMDNVLEAPANDTTVSACFCALSQVRHHSFLEAWDRLAMQVLPPRNVGVVDRSLQFYPQLDESTLNACLNFLPDAPKVQPVFQMDKEREHLFVHFSTLPKPWEGWTRRAFRFFDEYVGIVEWAASQGYELPGTIPFCLKKSNKAMIRLLTPWMQLKPKLTKRLKGLFCRRPFA